MDVLFGGEDDESESDESDGFSGVKVRLCVIVIARIYTHCLLKRFVVVTAARFRSS